MPQIVKGATDVTRYVMLRDSAAGTPETAYTITGLDLQYTRNRTAPAAKVDATALAATDSAHGDNQAIEVNATSSPGLYRIDWPDAAFATGVDKVLLVVSGTGLDPAVEEIELVDFSLEGQSAIDLKDFADAGYDPATNKVQGVVLVDTTTTNTDMRGTDNALLANSDGSGLTEAGGTGDHLTALATAANLATVAGYIDTEIGTIITHLTDIKGATWATTDSLEAIRDRGDSAWITATGFSTHSAADVWAAATRTLTALGFDLAASDFAAGAIDAAATSADFVTEIRNAITGGAYALNTSATGSIRVVDGTGTDEISLTAGLIAGIAGTIQTLDALDTAQDVEHDATQALVAATAIRAALGMAAATYDTDIAALPTAAENAAALLDLTDGIETSVTPRQALRAIAAKAAGLVSGAGTGTEVVKGIGQASGGTTRLTATVDSSGNISVWTLNL